MNLKEEGKGHKVFRNAVTCIVNDCFHDEGRVGDLRMVVFVETSLLKVPTYPSALKGLWSDKIWPRRFF